MLINPNSAQRKGKMARACLTGAPPSMVPTGAGGWMRRVFSFLFCSFMVYSTRAMLLYERQLSAVSESRVDGTVTFSYCLDLSTRCHTAHARMCICSGPPLTRSALDSFGRSGRAPNSLSKTFFFLRTVSVKRSRFQYVTGLALPRCICGLIGCTVHNHLLVLYDGWAQNTCDIASCQVPSVPGPTISPLTAIPRSRDSWLRTTRELKTAWTGH